MTCNPNYKEAVFALYRFEPSLAAAVLFATIFGISTFIHFIQMTRTRTWYLTAFVLGGLSEVIGYGARAVSSQQEPGCWTLMPFVVQSVLLLIAPALMAASVYMILGRVILLTDGEKYAIIKRRFLTKIFVTGDVVSLLMQASGGGLMALSKADNNFMNIGEVMIIIGLFVQLGCFGTFIIVSALFHRRMVKIPTEKASQPEIRWRKYLFTLYIASALIWVRSCFRVIEYLEGNDGHLMRHEVYIYIFDALLIFIVVVWMNWFHPSEIGLLLRGETGITNGLELIGIGRRARKSKHGYSSSLTS